MKVKWRASITVAATVVLVTTILLLEGGGAKVEAKREPPQRKSPNEHGEGDDELPERSVKGPYPRRGKETEESESSEESDSMEQSWKTWGNAGPFFVGRTTTTTAPTTTPRPVVTSRGRKSDKLVRLTTAAPKNSDSSESNEVAPTTTTKKSVVKTTKRVTEKTTTTTTTTQKVEYDEDSEESEEVTTTTTTPPPVPPVSLKKTTAPVAQLTPSPTKVPLVSKSAPGPDESVPLPVKVNQDQESTEDHSEIELSRANNKIPKGKLSYKQSSTGDHSVSLGFQLPQLTPHFGLGDQSLQPGLLLPQEEQREESLQSKTTTPGFSSSKTEHYSKSSEETTTPDDEEEDDISTTYQPQFSDKFPGEEEDEPIPKVAEKSLRIMEPSTPSTPTSTPAPQNAAFGALDQLIKDAFSFSQKSIPTPTTIPTTTTIQITSKKESEEASDEMSTTGLPITTMMIISSQNDSSEMIIMSSTTDISNISVTEKDMSGEWVKPSSESMESSWDAIWNGQKVTPEMMARAKARRKQGWNKTMGSGRFNSNRSSKGRVYKGKYTGKGFKQRDGPSKPLNVKKPLPPKKKKIPAKKLPATTKMTPTASFKKVAPTHSPRRKVAPTHPSWTTTKAPQETIEQWEKALFQIVGLQPAHNTDNPRTSTKGPLKKKKVTTITGNRTSRKPPDFITTVRPTTALRNVLFGGSGQLSPSRWFTNAQSMSGLDLNALTGQNLTQMVADNFDRLLGSS